MMTGGRWITTGLAAGAGVALQLQQAELWPRPAYVGAIVVGLACGLVLFRGRHRQVVAAWPGLLAGALLALAMGWGWAGWRASLQLADALDPALMRTDVELIGTVAQLPRVHPDGYSFEFEVDSATVHGAAVQVPRRVLLGWHRGLHEGELRAGPPKALFAGQRWRLRARLGPPVGLSNPHGFDLELWLFEQGVRAVGQVRARVESGAEPLGDNWRHPIERVRGLARAALFERVPDPRAAGILAGLALGDQPSIDARDWDTFRRTGVAHLLAVSGLHITMFAWGAAWIVRRMWSRWPRALRLADARSAGRWGGLVLATGYALFSGWGVPAQRTIIMLGVVALLTGRARSWPWPMVWLASALVVVGFDPWSLLQPGFWLSFAAVGLLMMSTPARMSSVDEVAEATTWRGRIGRAAAEGVRTQSRAALGLSPLAMLFFNQVSLVGFGANLLAIPWVTIVVTPLALAGLIVPPLWSVGAVAAQGMAVVLEVAAGWSWAVHPVASAPAWINAAGLLGAALALIPAPLRLRAWALPLCLPLLWPPSGRVPQGEFETTAIDVGQGTAVLVRTEGHTLLFDAGPQYSRDSDAGTRVLVPLLQALGIGRLDTLVLSHGDLDHVGGAGAVMASVTVAGVASSLAPGHALLQGLGSTARVCQAGQRWTWDGVRFEFLHPTDRDLERAAADYLKPNGVSCVLRVESSAGRSLLLTGDIEFEQEWALVRREGEKLRSDVLMVPHHGSTTSSSDAFLKAVHPDLGIIQSGWRNRYGHPAPSILARYQDFDIPVLASPACGAWQWRSSAPTTGQCTRTARRRYWHTRFDADSAGGLELAKPEPPPSPGPQDD